MSKKRGLGKSLDALLSFSNTDALTAEAEPRQSTEKLSSLPLEALCRGKYQPRRDLDTEALEELANSIRAQGIIQPLIVRPVATRPGTHQYEIIAGERRWRAAKLAGLTEVPVIIRSIPDEAAVAIALIENIQRQNLNPIEEAFALQRLLDEFGMTHQQVATAVGKSRTSVTNLLRLLSLPGEIKKLLERGLIEMGHARSLITLPESAQLEVAERIVARSLSVRETEEWVRRLQQPPKEAESLLPEPHFIKLQNELSNQLKLPVAISHNKKGKGKLVIQYKSLAELNGLLAQFEPH